MTGFNPLYIKDQLRGLFRYTEKEGKHHRLKSKNFTASHLQVEIVKKKSGSSLHLCCKMLSIDKTGK